MKKTECGAFYIELNNFNGHYEMGKAHGVGLKKQIQEVVNKNSEVYKRLLENQYDEFCRRIMDVGYLDDIKSQLPHFYDELNGIADGAEVDFKELLLWNLSEEPTFLMYDMLGGNEGFLKRSEEIDLSDLMHHCTCLTCLDDLGRRIVAQNFDFPAFYDGYQTLFKINYIDGRVFYIYGFAGQVGMIGLSKGRSVLGEDYLISGTHTTLVNGKSRKNEGITSIMTQRALLECSSTNDAMDFVKNIKRSPANSFTIGDLKEAVILEATHSDVVPMRPNENDYVFHTNHCLRTKDTKPSDLFKGENGEEPDFNEDGLSYASTVERYNATEEFLSKTPNPSVEMIQKFLRTEPVLRQQGFWETLMSFIAVLDPKEPHIYIALSSNDKEGKFDKFVL